MFFMNVTTIFVILLMLVVTNAIAFGIAFSKLSDDAMLVAKKTSESIDGDKLNAFKSNLDAGSREFSSLQRSLIYAESTGNIKSVYTLAKKDESTSYFLVDGSMHDVSVPGEKYPMDEGMQKAYAGEVYTTGDVKTDEYGSYISAYAPISNSNGDVIAIVGADTDVATFLYIKNLINGATLIFGLIILIGATVFGRFFSASISKNAQSISSAIGKLAAGDLTQNISVTSNDEFEAIAKDIYVLSNKMHFNLKNYSTKVFEAFIEIIELNDTYTKGHSKRVAAMSSELSRSMGIKNRDALKEIYIAAYLHDIGKIAIPKEILTKPDRLTDSEFSIVREHSKAGAHIVAHIPQMGNIAEIIDKHHERVDGSGYPYGMHEDDIPFASKIIAICDSYDAMTSDRAYRKGQTKELAVCEIQRCSGSQFSLEIAEAFLKYIKKKNRNCFKQDALHLKAADKQC